MVGFRLLTPIFRSWWNVGALWLYSTAATLDVAPYVYHGVVVSMLSTVLGVLLMSAIGCTVFAESIDMGVFYYTIGNV